MALVDADTRHLVRTLTATVNWTANDFFDEVPGFRKGPGVPGPSLFSLTIARSIIHATHATHTAAGAAWHRRALFFGSSATIASVVISRPAMEAASSSFGSSK